VNAPAMEYPHSIDAERSVLAAVLLRNDTWSDVRDAVCAEDFYRHAHRVVFSRMEGLAQLGRVIDLVTLHDALARHGEVDDVGGASYISRLIDGVARSTNAVHYAEVVRDHARRRKAMDIGRQLVEDAARSDDVNEVIGTAEKSLREVEAGRSLEVTSIADAITSGMDDLERAAQSEYGITGVPTGFFTLDRMLGGLQAEDLIIVAARPSVGKSALLGQMVAYAALDAKLHVTVVTLEMRASKLALRMASARARVDLHAVRSGTASPADLAALNQHLEALHGCGRINFIDTRDIRMSDVRRHARRLRAQGKLDLLALDYLALTTPEKATTRGENRQEQVAAQSKLAKSIARELGIPFVVLNQLDRGVEKDGGTKKTPGQRAPRLSDLRESGAIEQDADAVIFVHRPYVRPETFEERLREGETELIVAKQRNGPIGKVRARYVPAWVRFDETEGE
jgi:replicative DNA helicase